MSQSSKNMKLQEDLQMLPKKRRIQWHEAGKNCNGLLRITGITQRSYLIALMIVTLVTKRSSESTL